MSRISTEQWERRKYYLVRSLFDEKPLLSPISETQELSVESLMPNETPDARPYSPLPDLIIEKEPNRHDEPEEFYQALERKIIKLYRKLFIDAEISFQSSELSQSIESGIYQPIEEDYYDFETYDKTTTLVAQKTSTENEESSYEETLSEMREKTNSMDPSMKARTTSSESQENEIIVTQALVHRPANEEIDDYNYDAIVGGMRTTPLETQNEGNVDNVLVVDTSSITDVEDNSEQSGQGVSNSEQHEDMDLSADEGQTTNTCQSDASPEEPEIMRRLETSNNSGQSINSSNGRRYFSMDKTADQRFDFSPLRQSDDSEDSSPELSIILCSTSASKIMDYERGSVCQDKNKKRRMSLEITSHSSSSPMKQRKFENLATQTSFSICESESNWHEIQNFFFVGSPRIFKLCSCSNHDCC